MKILRDYQKAVLKYARSVRHPALLLEMRLGKTLITIRTIKTYKKDHKRKILVVAPQSAHAGWVTELQSEGFHNIGILMGSQKERLEVLSKPLQWYITNYEASRVIPQQLKNYPWDVVILDESTKIKSPTAGWSKYFVAYFRRAKHRFILSGTPDPESDLDFVMQMQFLDKKILGVQNYYSFRMKYCRPGVFGHEINPKHKDWFKKQIAMQCFSLKRSDVDLQQEVIHTIKSGPLPKKLQKKYRDLEDLMLFEINGQEMSTMNTMTSFLWSRQLASGIVNGEVESLHKFNMLYECIEEINKEPAIIWASYIPEIQNIETFLENKGFKVGSIYGGVKPTERELKRKLFQSGKYDYLVINPEVFKYGTDLSRAKTMIWFSLPLSAETYEQARDRSVKVGSTDSLLNIYLCSDDTIDFDIYNNMFNKTSRSKFNHSLIKRIRERKGIFL